MLGSVGILPALSLVGSGIAGGGSFGMGFSLLSGMLTSMIRPQGAYASFGNLTPPSYNTPFGSLQGGPNAESVGSLAQYIGQQYAQMGLPVPSPTVSGQYFGNAAYNFGNSGVSYGSPVAGSSVGDYRQGMSQLSFGGDLNAYHQNYVSMNNVFPSSSFDAGSTSYGSSLAPYSQSFTPMLTPYSSGYPQQFNPAATLYGYQSGSLSTSSQGPSYFSLSQGGPSRAQAIIGSDEGSSSGESSAQESSSASFG